MDQPKEKTSIQPRRILIADDEFLIRWSLSQALSQEGYHVIAVEDGKKAIEAAQSQHFDFIITDLVMPELGGWEVLEFMRKTTQPPRVIMMTAHGKEDTERIARERGAWAYVQKPFIIDKVKQILKDALSGGAVPSLNLSYSPS